MSAALEPAARLVAIMSPLVFTGFFMLYLQAPAGRRHLRG